MPTIDNRITSRKYIYKYMPINDFTLHSLKNNNLFFNTPNEFNDPFDCQFFLKIDSDLNLKQANRFYNSTGISETEKSIKLEIFKSNKNLIKKDIEDNFNYNLRKSYCIACFSEINNSILMWSHYADKHKGICLKFDWKIHEAYFKGYKVKYRNKIPEASLKNKVLDATEIFLTKLNHWRYERELRSIALVEEGLQIAKFNPLALKGIIFGEKVDLTNKKIIENIIEKNSQYINIKYFNCKLQKENSKIKIVKH
jgi:hypothetical protein